MPSPSTGAWRLSGWASPAPRRRRAQAEANRDQAKNWIDRLPSKADKPADAAIWFKVGPAANPPRTCETLEGIWAEDIDSRAAAILVHEPLVADQEHVLLASKGNVLAMEWETEDNSRVLAIANGSFLLNLPLVNHARRPLAERVVEWIGDDSRRVAFVRRILRSERTQPASFALRLVAAHPELSLGGHSAWPVWPAGLPGPRSSAGPAPIRSRLRQRSTRRSRRSAGQAAGEKQVARNRQGPAGILPPLAAAAHDGSSQIARAGWFVLPPRPSAVGPHPPGTRRFARAGWFVLPSRPSAVGPPPRTPPFQGGKCCAGITFPPLQRGGSGGGQCRHPPRNARVRGGQCRRHPAENAGRRELAGPMQLVRKPCSFTFSLVASR